MMKRKSKKINTAKTPPLTRTLSRITVDGSLAIRTENWSREAFAAELRAAHKTMKMGSSVMEELRRKLRY